MGFSNNSKSYRVYNPATRRIIESGSVIFIETSSLLFPPSLEENVPANYFAEQPHGLTHLTDDDFLRDLRDDTFELEPLPAESADHIAAGWLSDNPQVAKLVEGISEITRRDILDGGATGPLQKGAMPGGKPTDGVSQEGLLKPQE